MSDEKNITKVKLTICGNQFVVKADESIHYIQKIAKIVDERVKEIEDSSSKINIQMATIIAALNYCDQYEKEKMITRELLKKTEDSETLAKEAAEKMKLLMIENEQLKEEKAGLHKIIAELKENIVSENNKTENNPSDLTTAETGNTINSSSDTTPPAENTVSEQDKTTTSAVRKRKTKK